MNLRSFIACFFMTGLLSPVYAEPAEEIHAMDEGGFFSSTLEEFETPSSQPDEESTVTPSPDNAKVNADFLSSTLKVKEPDKNQPVLYYADTQTYDRELGILILKGEVEFAHEGNVLEADCVTYNEQTDVVTASGNVRLRQPDGDIHFCEYLELTGDMKDGVILQLKTLLDDDSKIAAFEGRKYEDRQELDRAVYTPCKLCGDSFPTWQINARRAVKNDTTKDITFTDAEFRFFDTPLLYLPYATQPLERRSGFLLPRPGFSTDFGELIQIPYYIVLSEDKDITITPVIFSKQHPMVFGEYRQAFDNGIFNLEGAIANYKKSREDKRREKQSHYHIPETRGYVYGDLRVNLNDIWRLKLMGGVVSDKTFFRKYKITGWRTQNALTSQGILEGFLNQRDYAAIKTYYFQGLRVGLDDQARIAAPLPIIEYSAYSDTDPLGGRFKFDANFLNLYREKGLNMQRGIGQLGWKRPWNTLSGQVFTPFASVRGDLYKVEHSHDTGLRRRERNIIRNRPHTFIERRIDRDGGGRFFPQAGVDWRWPFINIFCQQSFVVQPVGQLIAAPDTALGVKQRKIPNEDSQVPEFNDGNLFSPDRFSGYDRIDTGSRFVYGGEFLTTGDLFGDIEVFLGQSYALSHFYRDRRLAGLTHKASDFVGRIEVSPFNWLSFDYRFRADQKSFHPRMSEAGASLGPPILTLSGTYLFMSRHAGVAHRRHFLHALDSRRRRLIAERRDFNQLNLTLSSQFTENWQIWAKIIKNLQKRTITERRQGINDHHGFLSQGVGIRYQNDCFGLGLSLTRQYYRSVDLRPATIGLITVWLKNLGNYGFSFNPDDGLFGDRKPSQKTP